MTFFRRYILIFFGLSIIMVSLASRSAAQELKIVVPFSAGSGSDTVARLISSELSTRLGQQIVVINQAGASGLIATQRVKSAEPDGNTLLWATTNHVLLPSIKRDLGFDVVADFEPVMQISAGPLILAVNAELKVKNIADLIAIAKEKEKSGGMLFATAGVGTVPHLAGEQLSKVAGVKMTAVPYPGTPQAMTAVMRGDVSFYMGTLAVLPFLKSNLAEALAIASPKRVDFVKDVPTFAEQGLSGFTVEFWNGLLAPANTPAARIKQVQEAVTALLGSEKVKEALIREGLETKPTTAAQFETYLRDELARWSDVAKSANIQPE